jgi:hypothetical protein
VSAVLIVAAFVALALCVVVATVRLERSIARIPRTDIDEQVAAFRAQLDAYEESSSA